MFVSLIVTTGLFALLFRFLPDVHLRWRDVMIGALATAVLFTIGQQLIGLYLGQSSMASSYGAAGSVMILLLWVYYSCQILLLGAEFTACTLSATARSRTRSPSRKKTLAPSARRRGHVPSMYVRLDHFGLGQKVELARFHIMS